MRALLSRVSENVLDESSRLPCHGPSRLRRMNARPIAATARRHLPAVAAFALVFAAPLVTLWPALEYGFHGVDDPGYVVSNPVVHHGLTLWGALWALTTFEHSNWHPLTWWSYLLDVELFGVDPHGIRLMSMLWHSATCVALLAALRRLTGSLWLSTFAVALFAIHPTRLESVVWISERKDVLSGFFFALALLLYAKRPTPRIAPVAIAMLLGVASKPSVVVLPVILLLLDFWPLRRFEDTDRRGQLHQLRSLVVEKLPLFAIALMAGVLTILAQKAGGAVASLEAHPPTFRLINSVTSLRGYLGDLFWPSDLRFFYSFPRFTLLSTLSATMLVLVLSWGSLRLARSWPHLVVGWWWFLVAMLPTIGLIQVGAQARADRYTYLPSIGMAIAVSWTFGRIGRRAWAQRAALLLATVVVLALGATTRHHLAWWKDDQTLWQRVVELEPDRYWGWMRLGVEANSRGAYAEAVPMLERATTLRPAHPYSQAMLAISLSNLGEHDRAIALVRAAVNGDPNSAMLRRAAADVLTNAGKTEGAAGQLLVGIAAEPEDPLPYSQLASLLSAGLEPASLIKLIEAIPANVRSAELRALAELAQTGTYPSVDEVPSARAQAGVALIGRALEDVREPGPGQR